MMVKTATAVIAASAVLITLTSCRTGYRGWDSQIDGELWRQVAAIEDPLWRQLFELSSTSPDLESIAGSRWDGRADPDDLGIAEGTAVLYDVEVTRTRFTLSAFISSGPRPDVPSDRGDRYAGPSQVFTCLGYSGRILSGGEWEGGRVVYDACPDALVAEVPADAAFATDDVFDG